MAPQTRFPRKAIAASLMLALGTSFAAPVAAQSDDRIRKLESEVRALQRAVFPGGDGRYFEPEIAPTPQQPTQQVGTPAESALTDVLARLSAIESQLAQLTAASEVNANALQELEQRMDDYDAGAGATGLVPVPPIGSAGWFGLGFGRRSPGGG